MNALLATGWDSVRLFMHVTAATLWVGGQLTLAALVPALRTAGPMVPKAAARAFNRVAWPAFGVLLVRILRRNARRVALQRVGLMLESR